MLQLGRQFGLFDGLEHRLQDHLLQLGLGFTDLTRPAARQDTLKLTGNVAAVQFWPNSGSLADLDVLTF